MTVMQMALTVLSTLVGGSTAVEDSFAAAMRGDTAGQVVAAALGSIWIVGGSTILIAELRLRRRKHAY